MKRIISGICLCIFLGLCFLGIEFHTNSIKQKSLAPENKQQLSKNEIQEGVEATFISGTETLEKKPIFCYDLGQVLQKHTYTTSSSRLNQNELNFYKTEGITYVVGQKNALLNENFQYVLGVILTDPTYHLNNGLQVGLDESEVKKIWNFTDIHSKTQVEESMSDKYPYLVQLSKQYDYDEAYWEKIELSETEWHMYDNGFYGKIGIIVFLKNHKIIMVSTDCSDNTFYTTNQSFYQFSINDLFLTNHPVLQNRLWIWTNWEQVLANVNQPYKERISDGKHDLNFFYREMQGITYITPQYETGDSEENLFAILVTDKKYRFGCGLHVGMDESELNSLGIPLTQYKKKQFESLDLNLLSELINTDYECIYTFDGGYMNPWETENALADLKDVEQDKSIHQLKLIITIKNHEVNNILAYL